MSTDSTSAAVSAAFDELLSKVSSKDTFHPSEEVERESKRQNSNIFDRINSYHFFCKLCGQHFYSNSILKDINSFFQKHINTSYHMQLRSVFCPAPDAPMFTWEKPFFSGRCELCGLSELPAFVMNKVSLAKIMKNHQCVWSEEERITNEKHIIKIGLLKKYCQLSFFGDIFLKTVNDTEVCLLCKTVLPWPKNKAHCHLSLDSHYQNFCLYVQEKFQFEPEDLLNGFNLEEVTRFFLFCNFPATSDFLPSNEPQNCLFLSNDISNPYPNVSQSNCYSPTQIEQLMRDNKDFVPKYNCVLCNVQILPGHFESDVHKALLETVFPRLSKGSFETFTTIKQQEETKPTLFIPKSDNYPKITTIKQEEEETKPTLFFPKSENYPTLTNEYLKQKSHLIFPAPTSPQRACPPFKQMSHLIFSAPTSIQRPRPPSKQKSRPPPAQNARPPPVQSARPLPKQRARPTPAQKPRPPPLEKPRPPLPQKMDPHPATLNCDSNFFASLISNKLAEIEKEIIDLSYSDSFCHVCDTYFSPPLKSVHLNSQNHKRDLEKWKKIKMGFTNKKFLEPFKLLNKNTILCLICEVQTFPNVFISHLKGGTHSRLLNIYYHIKANTSISSTFRFDEKGDCWCNICHAMVGQKNDGSVACIRTLFRSIKTHWPCEKKKEDRATQQRKGRRRAHQRRPKLKNGPRQTIIPTNSFVSFVSASSSEEETSLFKSSFKSEPDTITVESKKIFGILQKNTNYNQQEETFAQTDSTALTENCEQIVKREFKDVNVEGAQSMESEGYGNCAVRKHEAEELFLEESKKDENNVEEESLLTRNQEIQDEETFAQTYSTALTENCEQIVKRECEEVNVEGAQSMENKKIVEILQKNTNYNQQEETFAQTDSTALTENCEQIVKRECKNLNLEGAQSMESEGYGNCAVRKHEAEELFLEESKKDENNVEEESLLTRNQEIQEAEKSFNYTLLVKSDVKSEEEKKDQSKSKKYFKRSRQKNVKKNQNGEEKNAKLKKEKREVLVVKGLPKKKRQYTFVHSIFRSFGEIQLIWMEGRVFFIGFAVPDVAKTVAKDFEEIKKKYKISVSVSERIMRKGVEMRPLHEDLVQIMQQPQQLMDRVMNLIVEAESALESSEEKSREETVRNMIVETLVAKFPKCQCHLFGSRLCGLSMGNSDLDILFDCGDMYTGFRNTSSETEKKLLREIAKELRKSNEISGLIVVENAKVPIISFQHKPTTMRCDLSVKNGFSIHKSLLLKFIVSLDWRVKALILFLKHWAKLNRIHGSFFFSSYSISILVLFYLEQLETPILPTVEYLQKTYVGRRLTIAGWDCSFNTTPPSLPKNESTFSQLLLEFFEFYGKFNYSEEVIVPTLGRSISRNAFLNSKKNLPMAIKRHALNLPSAFERSVDSHIPMCALDPLDVSHVITRSISSKDLFLFTHFCELSRECLKKNAPV